MIQSRPVQWATLETNYPTSAFGWSGTAVNVAPPADFFTPNDGAAAQWINYELNQLGGQDVAAQNAMGSLQARNWLTSGPPSTIGGLTWTSTFCLAWQNNTTLDGAWVMVGTDSSTHYNVWKSTDLNAGAWSLVGASGFSDYHTTIGESLTPAAIAQFSTLAGSAHDNIVVGVSGDFGSNTGKCVATWSGTSWAKTICYPGTSSVGSFCLGLAMFNSLVVAVGLAASSSVGASWSADGLTWTMGTGSFDGSTQAYFFAQNGSALFCAPKGNGAKFAVNKTTDGKTWSILATTGMVNNSDTCVGFSYDASRQMLVLITDGGHLYTATNLSFPTWVHTGTGLSPVNASGQGSSLACLGSLWMVNLGGGKVAFSTDAGVTWTTTNGPVATCLGLVTSNDVILSYGTAGYRATLRV